jgi:hypothetical protein
MSRFSEIQGQFDSNTGYGILTNTFVRDERLIISHSAPGAYFSFGPCKDNILDVTAAVIPARISIDISERENDAYHINLQQPTWTEQRFMLSADCPGPSGDDLRDGDECLCLLLGRNSSTFHDYVIVLRKCPGSEGGSFNRIAITEFECHEHSQFENAVVRRLSVI